MPSPYNDEMAKKRKDPAAQELGRKGGFARKHALTPEERSEIARKAGKASAAAKKKKGKEKNAQGGDE
jgi:general stress protein YciG